MTKQEWIDLEGIQVPTILDEEVRYWPITYVAEKVLLRNKKGLLDNKQSEKLNIEIKEYKIIFNDKNIQNSKCISENDMINRLILTEVGRLSQKQRIAQNKLHKFLYIEPLTEKEFIINELPESELRKHDEYTQNLICNYSEGIQYQLCTKCIKYYPLDKRFFHKDDRVPTGYLKFCKQCYNEVDFFKSDDKRLDKVNKQIKIAGQELYQNFTKDKLHEVYNVYSNKQIAFLPDCYNNKDDYLNIIKKIWEEDKIKVEELNYKDLIDVYGLINVKEYLKENEIHVELFGEECFYYPWKYPCFHTPVTHKFEDAKIIFENYIRENGIKIKDKFTFKFGKVMDAADIKLNDLLGFVVWYYDYKYPGYKFVVVGKRYYKNEENVLFDLKCLIEQDMKIEISKIPLYLTKTTLRNNANPLYNYIVTNENGTLFEWIDKLYPNQFSEMDFDINYYRETFDSVEENQIHNILSEKLNNVIYNIPKNNKRLVTIDGMQPDWIVIGEEKCWIIEYFGMWQEKSYNTRIDDYKKRTEEKIEKYKKLKNYGTVFLYPIDLKENFAGVIRKIEEIR